VRRIPWEDLVKLGTSLLTAKGVPGERAGHIAEIAVRTEAYGIRTHGVRIFHYFDRMVGPEIDPRAEPVVVKETGATALIDGNRAFGQLAMRLATEIATRKAKTEGIAMVAVHDTFWIAGLAVYMIPIAEAGFMAQLWVQHSSGKDCAPFGGTEARFSTNPVAFAFPTAGLPMVSDFSTSVVAMGKVGDWIRDGWKPEDELFVDADGRATNDPAVMRQGGTMLFEGGVKRGYKGFAMSLWSEALTAAAGGRTNNPANPSRQAFNLTVIDPEAFAGRAAYHAEMARLVAWVKSSRLRPGVTEIRLPGERGLKALTDARENGVPLDDAAIERLNALARKSGLPGVSAE